jgi:hypothetical protein
MQRSYLSRPAQQKSSPAAPRPNVAASRNSWSAQAEESVIADVRAQFTPAEAVESKLRYLLRSRPIGISHLMTARLAANRPR